MIPCRSSKSTPLTFASLAWGKLFGQSKGLLYMQAYPTFPSCIHSKLPVWCNKRRKREVQTVMNIQGSRSTPSEDREEQQEGVESYNTLRVGYRVWMHFFLLESIFLYAKFIFHFWIGKRRQYNNGLQMLNFEKDVIVMEIKRTL